MSLRVKSVFIFTIVSFMSQVSSASDSRRPLDELKNMGNVEIRPSSDLSGDKVFPPLVGLKKDSDVEAPLSKSQLNLILNTLLNEETMVARGCVYSDEQLDQLVSNETNLIDLFMDDEKESSEEKLQALEAKIAQLTHRLIVIQSMAEETASPILERSVAQPQETSELEEFLKFWPNVAKRKREESANNMEKHKLRECFSMSKSDFMAKYEVMLEDSVVSAASQSASWKSCVQKCVLAAPAAPKICYLATAVYMDRLVQKTKGKLNDSTFNGIFISCFRLAAKSILKSDINLNIFSSVATVQKFNRYERLLLSTLGWRFNLSRGELEQKISQLLK